MRFFSDPFLKNELAFRGGTALNKLFFSPAARYSEDIDLVRTSKGPISAIADALRAKLEPWLGKPKTKPTARSFKMNFYFHPENSPTTKLRIKIEINVEENFSILKREFKELSIQSSWFSGSAEINTFHFNELIGTKLRALYQRSKGRDVFDLWLALQHKEFDIQEAVNVFLEYMKKSGKIITRGMFEQNIDLKLKEHSFVDDIGALLSPELKQIKSTQRTIENYLEGMIQGWNLHNAFNEVKSKILVHIPSKQ